LYHILYVDDEPGLLEIGKMFLEQSGQFRVDTISSAPSALTRLNAHTYDAIISDYQMPNMDGIEFLQTVRSSGNTIPFILFTGRGREEVVIQAINHGVDAYIQKGGDPEAQFAELSHRLNRAVTRERAERALEESEERYRHFFETTLDSVFISTPDGRLIDFNDALVEMCGYDSREEMARVSVSSLYANPDERLTFLEILERDGCVKEHQTQFRKKDGTILDVLITFVPQYTSEGSRKAFIGTIRDITLQQRAEEADRETSRRLAEIINFLPNATMVVDTEGVVVAWNQAMEVMSGIPAGDIIGKGNYAYRTWVLDGRHQFLLDYILRRDTEGIKAAYPHVRYKGNIVKIETPVTRRDGTQITLWVSATPLIDRNGEITGAIESLRDVTHQKSIERALRESNTYLDAVINNIADPLFIKDRRNRYVTLNDRFCQFTRHTREELLGKVDSDIFSSDEVGIFQKNDDEVFRTGEENESEETITDAHGTIHTTVTKKTRYTNPAGEQFIVGIVRDITERKMTAQALQLALKKLNMLSSITRHDILNKITMLRGFLALVKVREQDPRLLELLTKGDNAADAIREQLEFTQMYEDLGVQAPRWQEVATLFQSAGSQLPLRGIAIDATVPGISVYTDPLIEKVFYTLMENTLRHGGTVTSIRLSAEEIPDGLVITYRDNGVGIAALDKDNLFQKGFGKHTGLGLFLSREILSITGITITETGEPGTGVRFEMVVPKGAYRLTDLRLNPT